MTWSTLQYYSPERFQAPKSIVLSLPACGPSRFSLHWVRFRRRILFYAWYGVRVPVAWCCRTAKVISDWDSNIRPRDLIADVLNLELRLTALSKSISGRQTAIKEKGTCRNSYIAVMRSIVAEGKHYIFCVQATRSVTDRELCRFRCTSCALSLGNQYHLE